MKKLIPFLVSVFLFCTTFAETPTPEPEPTPEPSLATSSFLPVRVVAGFDTGLFVGATESETYVKIEVFDNGVSVGSKDYSLDKYHTLFYNMLGDLKINKGEMAVISADKPIVCHSVFVSPAGFDRTLTAF